MAFNFNPEDGLLNTDEFPDKPASGTVARNQFMRLFNQIKEYINGMETNGVKAKGGNADTVGGKAPGQFADTHNHDNRYLSSNGGTVNGDIVMSHSKNIIFANDFGIKGKLSNGNSDYLSYMSADDRVVVGYNNREIIINCDNPIQRNGYKMWHEDNFKKEEYAKTSVGGLGTDSWYWKDETTGLIKQGGSVTLTFNENENVIKTFNFKIPFPNGVQTIIASEKTNNITYKGMFNIACWENDKASATIQAVVLNLYPRKGTVVVYWEATGY